VTSFGGGLKGTGVPLIFKKWRIEKTMRIKPAIITGEPMIRVHG
jgi:hypothetical protein